MRVLTMGYERVRGSWPSHRARRVAVLVGALGTLVTGCGTASSPSRPLGGPTSPAETVQGPVEIADLHMFTPNTGWAWGGGGNILHTTLGVQQWTLVPPPVGQLHVIEVACVDSQSARVLASSGSSEFVGTYHLVDWSTDDGGATWTQGQPFTALDETVQSLYSATDLDFVARTHGWFFDTQDGTVGSPIFIFRTVDDGMHWSQVEMTPSTGRQSAGMLAVSCAKNVRGQNQDSARGVEFRHGKAR